MAKKIIGVVATYYFGFPIYLFCFEKGMLLVSDYYNIERENSSIVINSYGGVVNVFNGLEKDVVIEDEKLKDDFINSKSFKLYPKKLQTIEIAKLYRYNGDYEKSRDIFYCAKNVAVWEKSHRIKSISLCRSRMCPACSWRKSQQNYKRALYAATLAIYKNHKYNFIFVTLTVKNCVGDDLSSTITNLLNAYRKLVLKWKLSNMKGSIKTLEVTVNWDNMTYHPHLHIIYLTPENYFSDPDLYVTQQELKNRWADKLNISDEGYRKNLQVSVNSFANGTSILKSLKEITKYMMKYGDLVDQDIPVWKRAKALKYIDNATKNRRMLEFTGLLREKPKNQKEDIDENVLLYCFNYKTNLYEEI